MYCARPVATAPATFGCARSGVKRKPARRGGRPAYPTGVVVETRGNTLSVSNDPDPGGASLIVIPQPLSTQGTATSPKRITGLGGPQLKQILGTTSASHTVNSHVAFPHGVSGTCASVLLRRSRVLATTWGYVVVHSTLSHPWTVTWSGPSG
jgi:hypothetical protein